MLYVLSQTEDPTEDDVVVVEATSAPNALAQQDWIADEDELFVYTINKASKEKFVASRRFVFEKAK